MFEYANIRNYLLVVFETKKYHFYIVIVTFLFYGLHFNGIHALVLFFTSLRKTA